MKKCIFAISAAIVMVLVGSATAEQLDTEGYWSGAQKIHRGVKLKELHFEEPRLMHGYVMRVDLKTSGISFVTTGRDPKWGEVMPDYTNGVKYIRTRRETTVDFMKRYRQGATNVIVAVNTAPWSPFCPPWNHKWADPGCWMVSDGVEVCETKRGQGAFFAVYNDGSVAITNRADFAAVRHVQSGFTIIGRDGVDLINPKDRTIHPRTAFGLSKDKRYFYILVIDGRQNEYSIGADYHDLCRILFAAGASDAINMDGGGSTSLVYFDEATQTEKMVNHHKNNSRRTVASNLGIVFEK